MTRLWCGGPRRWPVGALLSFACGAGIASGADVYTPATRQLSLPSVSIGAATYTNLVVTVGGLLQGPSGGVSVSAQDTYDPFRQQLLAGTVAVGAATYHNVGVSVAGLVSAGAVTGADVYDGTTLTIPYVKAMGGAVYTDVVVAPGKLLTIAGGMPANSLDVYDPSSNQLTIAGLAVHGRVYTNVTATVGRIISVGGGPAVASTLAPTGATAGASTGTFDFSYVFGDGQVVTGDFTGTTTNGGQSVTDISNLKIELNGIAFAPVTVGGVTLGNATLQADAWNPATASFSDTTPVTLYANGALNNFIFADVDAASNTSPDYLFGYVNDATNGINEVFADNFLQSDAFSQAEGNPYQQALDTPGTAADWTLTEVPAQPVGEQTDAPLPPWAFGVLGACLLGLGSRRSRNAGSRGPPRGLPE